MKLGSGAHLCSVWGWSSSVVTCLIMTPHRRTWMMVKWPLGWFVSPCQLLHVCTTSASRHVSLGSGCSVGASCLSQLSVAARRQVADALWAFRVKAMSDLTWTSAWLDEDVEEKSLCRVLLTDASLRLSEDEMRRQTSQDGVWDPWEVVFRWAWTLPEPVWLVEGSWGLGDGTGPLHSSCTGADCK